MLRPAALELGFYEEVEGSDGEPHKRSTLDFHALRHTCASMLFERGRNVRQVQEWLGHADPSLTLRTYVHLMDEGVGSGLDLDDSEGNGWATQALPNPANPVEVGSSKGLNSREKPKPGKRLHGPRLPERLWVRAPPPELLRAAGTALNKALDQLGATLGAVVI